jgi:PAS domain S-box-containing protein
MQRASIVERLFRDPPRWVSYPATILLVAAVYGIYRWLWPALQIYPFFLFFPIIIVAAAFFDRGSGYLATILSVLVITFIFPPVDSSLAVEPRNLLALIVFLPAGLALSALLELRHRLLRQTRDALKQARVAEERTEVLLHGLHQSEARFRQFAEAASGALWIRDAQTLRMEWLSPAFDRIYGFPGEELLDANPQCWASLIVPDDRAAALGRLEEVKSGKAVVHEFRVVRASDGAFRWIRSTDFPLFDEHDRVQRIGGIAEDVTEAKLAAEHQGVLLAELQHRVRNIMAQIRSITARTGERAETVSEYADLMAGRLLTFARVQALLTRSANIGARILDIINDELAAQAGHPEQYTLHGPDLVLAPKTAEVLTLAVHELTTNALKYGGLSVPDGRVTARWTTFERGGASWLGLDWIESGAPTSSPADLSAPRRRGFGSEMIEGRIPYELGGRGELSIHPGGARCRLEFPLRDRSSILETDAPRRAAIYGGLLDMAGEPDLSGHRILVVEDDYYLATDTARALRSVGVEVIGPYPTEEGARTAITNATPTGVILDLNLGDQGPSFVLAAELQTRGVPFIMVTGYDAAVIPAEFETITRLQKPVQIRQIVGALARKLGGAA